MQKKSPRTLITWISLTLSRNWFPGAAQNNYAVSTWIFLRALALIYFFQFLSLSPQILGLIGNDGILPAREVLNTADKEYGLWAMLHVPTLFWYGTPDWFLPGVCWIGMFCSILLFLGIYAGAMTVALYICLLSCASVGGDFFSFIGDRLLLEVGFLSMFLTSFIPWMPVRRIPNPPAPVRLLFWWLLFRIFAQETMYDLAHGIFDPHFFQNQPLPSWPSWYLSQLPPLVLGIFLLLGSGMRIVFPVLIFGPPRFRHWSALFLCLLQCLPLLTGNYAHFALLIAVSCLFLLDDAFWIRLVPRAKEHLERLAGNKYRGFSKLSYSILLSSVFIVTTIHMSFSFLPRSESPSFLGLFSSFGLVNDYALDVASGEWRTELHVEGSRDDRTWKAYSFRFKPERSKALSPILFSHHPRLDWQMAYAVRSVDRPPEWISRFCNRLLEGSPSVVDLMENNPFKDLTPRAVRIYRYDLELSDFAHRDEGAWIEPFHSRDLLLQCTKS